MAIWLTKHGSSQAGGVDGRMPNHIRCLAFGRDGYSLTVISCLYFFCRRLSRPRLHVHLEIAKPDITLPESRTNSELILDLMCDSEVETVEMEPSMAEFNNG